MYSVTTLYPYTGRQDFDLKHYLEVHTPLGLGLLRRHFGVVPAKVFFQTHTYGVDRTSAGASFALIATMLFDRKEDADRFIDIFDIPEVAARLQADFDNYTGAAPIAVLGEYVEIAPDHLLLKSDALLEGAR